MSIAQDTTTSAPDQTHDTSKTDIKSETTTQIDLDPTSATEKEIAPYLESLSRDIITAINTRNFAIDSAPWINVADTIETNRDAGPKGSRSLPKTRVLAVFDWMAVKYPHHRIEIDSTSCVVHKAFVWSRRGRTAEVLVDPREHVQLWFGWQCLWTAGAVLQGDSAVFCSGALWGATKSHVASPVSTV